MKRRSLLTLGIGALLVLLLTGCDDVSATQLYLPGEFETTINFDEYRKLDVELMNQVVTNIQTFIYDGKSEDDAEQLTTGLMELKELCRAFEREQRKF